MLKNLKKNWFWSGGEKYFIRPKKGRIRPKKGRIRPKKGRIRPKKGRISTFSPPPWKCWKNSKNLILGWGRKIFYSPKKRANLEIFVKKGANFSFFTPTILRWGNSINVILGWGRKKYYCTWVSHCVCVNNCTTNSTTGTGRRGPVRPYSTCFLSIPLQYYSIQF